MIIKVDSKLAERQIHEMFTGMKEILKPVSKKEMSKAIFTIAGKEFIRHMNKRALSDRKSYFHLYEWGKVGTTSSKLFEIKRVSTSDGAFKIIPFFLESRTPVPIPRELRIPGKTGKFVSKRFVFREMAQVMESGEATRPFSSKRGPGTALVLVGNNGKPLFIRYPRTTQVLNPGGRRTTGSFFKQFESWFNNPNNIENALMKTSYFKALEDGIARILNKNLSTYAPAIRSEIIAVSGRYSKGIDVL